MKKYISSRKLAKIIILFTIITFIGFFHVQKISAYYQKNVTQVETIITQGFENLNISTDKTEYGMCSGNTTVNLTISNTNDYKVGYTISLSDSRLSYTVGGSAPSSYTIAGNATSSHSIIISGTPTATSLNVVVTSNSPYGTTVIKTITFDMSCPVCTWTPLINANKYIKNENSASYTITCTDSSGIATSSLTSSAFTLSDSSLATITGVTTASATDGYTYTVTVTGNTGNGNTTLSLNADAVKDNNGNNNAKVTSDVIIVDNIAPTVSYNLTGGTYDSAQTVTVTPADSGGSGLGYYNVHVYKGISGDFSNLYTASNNITTSTHSVDITEDGTYTFYAMAYDNAGNITNNGEWYVAITYVIDTTVNVTYNYNLQNNDMTKWQQVASEYHAFNVSYDSSSQESTLIGNGVGGWEVIYFPINTISGKTYNITFNYEIPTTYNTYSTYQGIGYQALTSVNNSSNMSTSLATNYLPTIATSGSATLTFTATGSTTYFAFNYGMAADGSATTVKFNNFNVITSENKTINSTYNSLITPTREGYTFNGWYTSINGGTRVTNTTPVSGSSDHTIYAHWTPSNVQLTYSSSNLIYGLNDIGATTNANMTYSISNKVVTVTGLTDDGWGMTSGRVYLEAGKTYTFNTTISSTWNGIQQAYLLLDGGWNASYHMEANVNYQFTPTATGTYHLRLDVNATNSTQTFSNIKIEELMTVSKTVGSAIGSFPNLSRPGYSFVGWYTAESGGTQIATSTIVPTISTTYYAHWVDNIAPSVPTSNVRVNNSSGSILATGPNTWYNYTLWWGDFYATDTGGSGLNRIELSNGCTGVVQENAYMPGYTYTTDMNYFYCLRSVDNVGNASSWSEPVYLKIDMNKPSISLPTNPLYVKKGSTVNLLGYASASDALSQLRSFTSNYSTPSGLGVGSYTLTYTAVDNANNTISSSVVMAVYDKILCDGSITTSGNANGLYRDPIDTTRCIYRGANPNNYVRFNGTYSGNTSSGGTLYRIIGIETDGRIKMVHSSTVGNMAWHSSSSSLDYNSSTIRTYLNGTYYNSLNAQAKAQIQTSQFYIGQMNYYNSTSYNISQTVTAEKATLENNASYVGLMNVYDFLLGSTNCSGATTWKDIATKSGGQFTCDINNWMVYPTSGGAETWFITKYSSSRVRRWLAVGCTTSNCESSNSGSIQYASATVAKQIRPVTYLKESVIVVGGTGTASDPYILSASKFISNESPTTCSVTTTSGYESSKVLTINPSTTSGITYSFDGINYSSSRTKTIASGGTYNAYIKDAEGRTNNCSITIASRAEYQHQTCSSCKSCYYCSSGDLGGDQCYIGKRGYGELYIECTDLGFSWYNGECYNSQRNAAYGTTCGYCGCNSWNTGDTAWYTNSCGTSNYSSCKNMATRYTFAPA